MRQPSPHGTRSEVDSELDALVLAEMESLDTRIRPPRPTRSPGPAVTSRARPARAAPDPARPVRAPTPLGRRPEADVDRSGEEFEALFEAPLVEESDGPDLEDAASAGGLLSLEEEAFITRAVGFLSQREHADMILGRIWEQLTELDPEAFYQAPAAAVEPTAAADGPRGQPSPGTDPPDGPAS